MLKPFIILDEPRAQGKPTSNSRTGPITLPELTPIGHQSRQAPIGESSPNVPSFPSTDTFAPQLPSPQGRPRQLPKVTGWGDEDVEAIRGNHGPPKEEESFGTGTDSGLSPPGEAPIEETGDSGANFGGPIGAPPPGFNEAFGLNGASVPLEEIAAPKEEEPTATVDPIFTTKKPR